MLTRAREGLRRGPPVLRFKERNRDLQELAREVMVLRTHNRRFRVGDPQDHLVLFAEGAMLLVCMERFLRAYLGSAATNADTLRNLLERALSKNRDDHNEPPGGDREHLIELVTGLRNGLLHGDFEQLAQISGCATIREYFSTRYGRDLDVLFNILNTMMRQIDPDTGKVYEADQADRWRSRLVDALAYRTNRLNAIAAARARARPK